MGTSKAMTEIVGDSKAARELRAFVKLVARSDVSILVSGESGTGKDVLARALVESSLRQGRPYLAVNCGALSETLQESTLFGHVRGAFTGASEDRRGLLEACDNGTLFLDEIGEAPPSLQVKLLRFLQEGTFLPVGGTKEQKVDVRIIAATNRDLADLVARGIFREDLYYRLNVMSIRIPALRSRVEDIRPLAEGILSQLAARHGRGRKVLGDAATALFEAHVWPGNIRELRNELERMYVLAGEETELGADLASESLLTPRGNAGGDRLEAGLEPLVSKYTRGLVLEVLSRNPTNHSAAARECGYTLQGFKALCERVGILLAPGHAKKAYKAEHVAF